jgi:alpha-beta hydrolase superfamily lysophospholipase
MIEAETRSVRARDGRKLCVRVGDAECERWVLVMDGMPGCGLLYRSWVEDAAARGIRLVSYDRPGYGGSARTRDMRLLTARQTSRQSPMAWVSIA